MRHMGRNCITTLLNRKGIHPRTLWFCGLMVTLVAPALMPLFLSMWSSKSISNEHLLRPTFAHGSTLGICEALAEKPYPCDIVTDSVIRCLFIETEKIHSALRSNPDVEDFARKCQWKILEHLLLKGQS